MDNFYVIEGDHEDPNNKSTMVQSSRKTHGPYTTKEKANEVAKGLIQKNVDNFYHRAWVINYN